MSAPFGERVRIRKRNRAYSGTTRLWQNGVVTSTHVDNVRMYGAHYTEDWVNPPSAWLSENFSSNYDIGGPFLSARVEYDFPIYTNHMQWSAFGQTWTYDGPVIANPVIYWGSDLTNTGWKNDAMSAVDSLDLRIALGSTAISRCAPAAPEASLGTTLVELKREGLPSLLPISRNMRGDVEFFRSLGSNYLNVEFGWKPFLADIRAAARSIQNQDQIVRKLQENSGKRMRRQYRFPDVVESSLYSQDGQPPWPSLNAYALSQAGRSITRKMSKKTWFSGEFIYHYPSVDDPAPEQLLAWSRHVLGVDLTPETLWNITPWTWLFDWFANVGDFLSNISAMTSDDLALRYGYLMQEVVEEYKHEHFGVNAQDGSLPPYLYGTFRRKVKSRIRATPYGFGLNWDGFSARQMAILAALGVTRGRLPSQG